MAEQDLKSHFRLEVAVDLEFRIPLARAVETEEAATPEIAAEGARRIDDLKAVIALWLTRMAGEGVSVRGSVRAAAPFVGITTSAIQLGETF